MHEDISRFLQIYTDLHLYNTHTNTITDLQVCTEACTDSDTEMNI